MSRPLPCITAQDCVHGISTQGGCADCIAACPHEALRYEAGSIILEPASCTGCGACVGACPTRAVSLDPEPPRPMRQGATLILVCQRHKAATGRPAPVCVRNVGLEQMAGWVLDGVARIACATGDCETCPEAGPSSLADQAAHLAALLSPTQHRAPEIAAASAAEITLWRQRQSDAPEQGRRALLRAVTAPLREETTPTTPALARLQSHLPPEAARRFVPVFSAQNCTGCKACLRMCPEQALTLGETADGPAFAVLADACTGCLLCEDICTDDAIEIDAMITPPPPLMLSELACSGCGVRVVVPRDGPFAAQSLCPTCTHTSNHKKLFQVFT